MMERRLNLRYCTSETTLIGDSSAIIELTGTDEVSGEDHSLRINLSKEQSIELLDRIHSEVEEQVDKLRNEAENCETRKKQLEILTENYGKLKRGYGLSSQK